MAEPVPPTPAGHDARRAAAVLGVALLVAGICVAAGLWQWNRHADRSAAVEIVRSNYEAAALPVAEVLTPGEPLPEDAVWQPVTLEGTYDDESTVLLRNRPVGGQPGYHVLTPLEISAGPLAGEVLVVDRGWVPTAARGSGPALEPAAPTGVVEVTARLRADEAPATRDAPAGQVHTISTDQVREAGGGRWAADATLDAYGSLMTENGSAPVDLGALARPSTDLGSHLSYAFQWWVFALGALGGGVVLLRRERAAEVEDDELALARASATDRPARRRRRPTVDDEEEDALLDAQQV
ncbi:SURF1 family protein [Actinotalea sp. BY-33]|uniref:SURF1-like protein n=1 Tax=Actinotalea soli TaxID=2819234 RepID=A0A939LMX6_9CELL|nr:SURF1 family protein [Actinotalea soli]MBO1750209.1 SURF1 family protein [Actinotalea soli]